MAKNKIVKSSKLPKPLKSKDLPATFGDLDKVRSELKSDITSVKLEVTALRSEMNSKFEEIKSTNQRMLALLEEQNSRNRAALDGYAAVHDAQLRLEDRVDKVEANQFDLAKLLKNKDV